MRSSSVFLICFLAIGAAPCADSYTFYPIAGQDWEPRLIKPQAMAVDAHGNLYVACRATHTIFRVEPSGAVSTFAGIDGKYYDSVDGHGGEAEFDSFFDMTIDSAGNLYVSENSNEGAIRKITPDGMVSTLARIRGRRIKGIAVDGTGSVYVTAGNAVLKVTPRGETTTFAGWEHVANKPQGFAGGGYGDADGTGPAAQFKNPWGLAVGRDGTVYVADCGNGKIRTITPGGVVRTLSVKSDGEAHEFDGLRRMAIDHDGNLYVSGSSGPCKVTPTGERIALSNLVADVQDKSELSGIIGALKSENAIAVDGAGNFYGVFQRCGCIVKRTPTRELSLVFGQMEQQAIVDGVGAAARFAGRSSNLKAVDRVGNLYLVDGEDGLVLRKITPGGVVSTLVGSPTERGLVDGQGSAARFKRIGDLTIDADGTITLQDEDKTRTVTPKGLVSTLNAPGPAKVAKPIPSDALVDPNGKMYFWKQSPDGCQLTCDGKVVGSFGPQDLSGFLLDAHANIYKMDYGRILRGAPTLDDSATIDNCKGVVNETRQLDTAARTATAWTWSLVRRPTGSSAQPSSTAVRNPTFTPDVADVYRFKLIATNDHGVRISYVDLNVTK